MPKTKAIAAIGAQLQASDQATTGTETPGAYAYTTLAEIRDITGPEMTAEELDVTNHSTEPTSAGGLFGENIPGFLDAGALTFDMNMIQDDPTQALFLSDFLARFRRWYHLIFPVDVSSLPVNDRTVEFLAYVQRHSFNIPVREALTKSCALRVIGGPEFGIGGSS